MTNIAGLSNKNGIEAKFIPCGTGGDYVVHSTVGDIVVYSGFFDKPNRMYCSEIKKRFADLSEECQKWLLELVKEPFRTISDENPLIRKLSKFHHELAWTGIHNYSGWNSGININDIRYYLVNEGIAKLK